MAPLPEYTLDEVAKVYGVNVGIRDEESDFSHVSTTKMAMFGWWCVRKLLIRTHNANPRVTTIRLTRKSMISQSSRSCILEVRVCYMMRKSVGLLLGIGCDPGSLNDFTLTQLARTAQTYSSDFIAKRSFKSQPIAGSILDLSKTRKRTFSLEPQEIFARFLTPSQVGSCLALRAHISGNLTIAS